MALLASASSFSSPLMLSASRFCRDRLDSTDASSCKKGFDREEEVLNERSRVIENTFGLEIEGWGMWERMNSSGRIERMYGRDVLKGYIRMTY